MRCDELASPPVMQTGNHLSLPPKTHHPVCGSGDGGELGCVRVIKLGCVWFGLVRFGLVRFG